MGVTELVPTLGARGGCQGWCGGRCWQSLLPPAFVLGSKPMTEKGGVRVCVHACVCTHTQRWAYGGKGTLHQSPQ